MEKIRGIGRPDGSSRYFAREGALLRNRLAPFRRVRVEQVTAVGRSSKLTKGTKIIFWQNESLERTDDSRKFTNFVLL